MLDVPVGTVKSRIARGRRRSGRPSGTAPPPPNVERTDHERRPALPTILLPGDLSRRPPTTGAATRSSAALLAVPPLDEVTRRRMVDVGGRASGRGPARPVGRTTAALGVAAALLLGVVVGAVVVTRPDDPQTDHRRPGAWRPRRRRPRTPARRTAAPTLAPAPGSENQLGDLGSRRVARPRCAPRSRTASRPGPPSRRRSSRPPVWRGPEAAGLVAVSAVGTATYADAGPVVVLVGTTPAGENVAVAVTPTDCTVVGYRALHD